MIKTALKPSAVFSYPNMWNSLLFSTLKKASVLCCGRTDIIELSLPNKRIAARVISSRLVSESVKIKPLLLKSSSPLIVFQTWSLLRATAIFIAFLIIEASRKSISRLGYGLFKKHSRLFIANNLQIASELFEMLISL